MQTEFLKNLGLDDDIIQKIMAENGKDIEREKGKATEYKTQLDTANEQLKTLTDTVKAAEGKDDTIKTLQDKVTAYEKAENARKESEQAAQHKAALKARFDPLKGENTYLNEGTENWIFGEFEKALADQSNAGKSDADIFAEVTKDKNIFVNNQQEQFRNPPVGRKQMTNSQQEYMKSKYGKNPWATL